MSLLGLIIALAIIGFVLWAVSQSKIDPTVKTIIWWVAIVCIVVFILSAFGLLDRAKEITVPKI
jgi:hypothetical protein